MEVSNSQVSSYTYSSTSSTTQTNSVNNEFTTELDSIVSKYSNNSNLEPTDISFDDYKKLSNEDLEKIFSGNSDKIGNSTGLLGYANLTNDDILNRIYFDDLSDAIKNDTTHEYTTHTLGLIAIMKLDVYFDSDSFDINDKSSAAEFIRSTSTKQYRKIEPLYTTKDNLFADFDKFKTYYENTKESWTDSIDMNKVFKMMDEIKAKYNQKVEENKALLNSYTRNTNDINIITQNEETTKTETTTGRTPKIVEFLDRYNKFSTLSETDEKIFREILADNKLTKEEANSLSYEQIERISNLLTTNLPLSKEELGSMPIVQMGVDLFATRITGNRQFNEAFYNSLKELNSNESQILRNEVDNNLGQLYLGKELRATFTYGGSYLANPWEYENMDANFGKFIKDVINHHEVIINDPKVRDEVKPQYQKIVDLYSILEKNYNDVISRNKYA